MDDVISRQDTINEIKNVFDDILCCNVSVRKGLPEAVRRIEMMPSAEPKTKCVAQIRIDRADIEDLVNEKVNEIVDKMIEPKIGEWVEVEKNEYEGFSIVNMRCNQCGRYAYLVLPKGTKSVYDYCPWCKADMRGDIE